MTAAVVLAVVSVLVAAVALDAGVDSRRRAAATSAALRLTQGQRDDWRQKAVEFQAVLRHEFGQLLPVLPEMRVSPATARQHLRFWQVPAAMATPAERLGDLHIEALAQGDPNLGRRIDPEALLAELGVELDPPDCPGTHRFAPILSTESATCPECGVVVGLEIAPDGGAGPVIGRHPVSEGER